MTKITFCQQVAYQFQTDVANQIRTECVRYEKANTEIELRFVYIFNVKDNLTVL